MIKIIVIVAFSLLISGTFGHCSYGWEGTPYGKCVHYFEEPSLTWQGAVNACALHGADLASVRTDDEAIWFQGWVSLTVWENRGKWDVYGPWIGGYADSNRIWWWKKRSGDQPMTVSLWDYREPNNSGGHENCIHYHARGFWNDVQCTSKFGYICEKRA